MSYDDIEDLDFEGELDRDREGADPDETREWDQVDDFRGAFCKCGNCFVCLGLNARDHYGID